MVKSSDYTRDLKSDEIKRLQAKYDAYLKRSKRSGFLPTETKKRLLRLTKWAKDTSNQEIYQFFSDIREHALSGLKDFQLLCETLNEKELEKVFTKEESYVFEKKKIKNIRYPITELIKLLLPHPLFARPQTKEFMQSYMQEREWRKYILEDLVIESLLWYFNSGLFQTNSQQQILFDAIDAIQVNSSGKKEYVLHTEFGGGMSIAKF